MKKIIAAFAALMLAIPVLADETLTPEPAGDAYHFSSSYRIQIGASVEKVWPYLVDYGSWMVDFDMSVHSGNLGQVGVVHQLYSGQDFFVQTLSLVPNQSVVIANLPSTFRGEHSNGIGVITLNETAGNTTVDITMARRYEPTADATAMREMRSSGEFKQGTRNTWMRFLGKLKELSEG